MNTSIFLFSLAAVIALCGGGYVVGYRHGAKFAIKRYSELLHERGGV